MKDYSTPLFIIALLTCMTLILMGMGFYYSEERDNEIIENQELIIKKLDKL